MNQRALIILAVSALVAISVALFLQQNDTGTSAAASEDFLPGLMDQANDLNGIALYAGGDILIGRFSRVDGSWITSNPAGYPADWSNIRELVDVLANAKVAELKTSNPDYYGRLGVRDSSDPEAAGIKVDLASETKKWSVIIGNNAESRLGQYARIPGQLASVLLDREISLSRDPIGWIEQQIVNLPALEIQGVTIVHPDGTSVQVSKQDADQTDYELVDVPEGRTPRTGFTINGVAGGLANLELQEVRAADVLDFSEATTAKFDCFDGRRVIVKLVKADERSWIRFAAEYASTAELGEDSEVTDSAASEWVTQINEHKSFWAFALPDYKYDALTRTLEDLLEPTEE